MSTTTSANKFGKKINHLFDLIESTPEWRKYLSPETVSLVEQLFTEQSMEKIMNDNNISYSNLRSRFLVAIKRIEEKKTSKIRNGNSEKSKQLKLLLDKHENWRDYLTETEKKYTEEYLKNPNFYEVGRILNVKPSNIAGALYGTTQRLGVITKLKAIDNQK